MLRFIYITKTAIRHVFYANGIHWVLSPITTKVCMLYYIHIHTTSKVMETIGLSRGKTRFL